MALFRIIRGDISDQTVVHAMKFLINDSGWIHCSNKTGKECKKGMLKKTHLFFSVYTVNPPTSTLMLQPVIFNYNRIYK